MAVDPRKGWLARLVGRSYERSFKTVVTRRERLSFTVSVEHADAVRDAVQRWLEGRGVTATVTATEASEGKAHLHAELGDADATKVDLSSDEVQDELQKVVSDAVS